MDVHQLRGKKGVHAVSHLSALYQACSRRYVDAANLLGVGGTVVDEIHQSRYKTLDLTTLLAVFWRAWTCPSQTGHRNPVKLVLRSAA